MKQENRWSFIIFIILFIFVNVLNATTLTMTQFNKYIVDYNFNAVGFFNSLVGNVGALGVITAFAFLFVRKRKSRYLYLIILTFFLNLSVFAVFIFCRFYSTVFSFNLNLFSNPGNGIILPVLKQVASEFFIGFRFFHFLPTCILIVYFLFVGKKDLNNEKPKVTRFSTINTLFTSTLVCLTSVFTLCALIYNNADAGLDVSLYGVKNGGFYIYYVSEMLGADFNPVIVDEKDEMKEIVDGFNKNSESYVNFLDNKTYSRDNNLTGALKGYNVFFIQLESHNNFVLNRSINNIEVTPYLNQLIKDNYYFENVMTSVGLGNTSDAELSVMTGLYANGESCMYWDYNDYKYDLETLPKLFNEQKYNTVSYHGNVSEFYNRGIAHPELLGFDKFVSKEDFIKDYSIEDYPQFFYQSWVNDEQMLNLSLNDAKKAIDNNESFFNFNVLLQPHTPYSNKGIKSYDWGNKNNKTQFAYYLDNIKNQDKQIGEFIEKAQSLLPNTLFVLYGDHGSGIYDKQIFDELGIESSVGLREVLTSIPVIMIDSSKNLEKFISKEEFNAISSLARSQRDIYRTIINLFDLYDRCQYIFGTDMFSNEPSIVYEAKNIDYRTDQFYSSLKNSDDIINYDNVSIDRQKEVEDFIRKYRRANNYFLENTEKFYGNKNKI